MVTKLGDIYDHIKDITVASILLLLLLIPLFTTNIKVFVTIVIILSIFFIGAIIQLGCQEKIYDSNNKDSLSFTKTMCSTDNPKKIIKYTRFFGTGTFNIILAVIIIFYPMLSSI